MIESFASGAMASLVAKNGTKKLFHNCLKVYFWMLLLKRGPKAPRRAPSPPLELEGGAQSAELLVDIIIAISTLVSITTIATIK